MIALIQSVIWSTIGLYATAIILIGVIVGSRLLGWPKLIANVAAIALAAHLAGGYFYNSGRDACEARVAAAVEAQRKVTANLIKEMRAELDTADEDAKKADGELVELSGRLGAIEAAQPRSRCRTSKEDVDAINRRR